MLVESRGSNLVTVFKLYIHAEPKSLQQTLHFVMQLRIA